LFNEEGKSRECAEALRNEFIVEYNRGINNFWIDITNIDTISSAFIGIISFISKSINEEGHVIIFASSDKIQKDFETTEILQLNNIELIIKELSKL
jgi:anti-anti-sigma regulatory factor